MSSLLLGSTSQLPQLVPAFDWGDVNPLTILGDTAAAAATEGWRAFMTALWAAGLWLTGFVFNLVDAFTAPDLSQGGVMRNIFPLTFAIGATLALVLGFVQLGVGAWQRDGKGLARLIIGLGQFMLAWGGMLGVGAALTVATSGLTQGILQVALGSPTFGSVSLLQPWDARQGVDTAAATLLGVLGIFLVFASIGYLLVMLVRAGALMVLMATSPISAAGLLSEGTRTWFWKSLRWFIAALMIGPLAALVLGIGKKLTDGVLAGAASPAASTASTAPAGSTEAAVGAAVIGTVLVMLSAFCPLILFRLLAFVDPGTSSGASFRASLDAAGGLGGLLGGPSGGQGGGQSGGQSGEADAGGGAATAQAGDGGSQGEADAGAATQSRVTAAMGAMGALGTGARQLSSLGQNAATYGADILGSAGVGHQQPYFGTPSGNDTQQPGTPDQPNQPDQDGQDDPGSSQTQGGQPVGEGETPAGPGSTPETPSSVLSPSLPSGAAGGGGSPASGAGAGTGAGGAAGGAGGAAGGAEAAAAVAVL